jgi:hypothetical protein
MLVDDLRRSVTHLMQCFLDSALETQFVILENGDVGDEFVQFKPNHRILYGEVGSREWAATDERRPLDADAQAPLAALGFTRGGPERNYICDNLAQSAPYLADLYLRLVVAAYGALPERLAILSNVEAVRDLAGPLARQPGFCWPAADPGRHEVLRTTPVTTSSPGLKFRVERALRSNFAEIGATSEELESLRHEIAVAGSFDALSEWAQDWIRKAEEGPLWVVLGANGRASDGRGAPHAVGEPG